MRAAARTLAVRLAALAACPVAAGCLAGPRSLSHLPPPDAGRDPAAKVARIEVAPAEVVAPAKARKVLIATVYDRDGDPWRRRKVEWTVDGPGSIVEVDAAGFLPGRASRVDAKSAVSYTDSSEHRVARDTGDPRDDFTVRAGQTWCVVTSPAEGETTVTARAEGADRAVVKLTWADSAFRFPPPAAARSGGEASLTTSVARPADAAGRPEHYKVRYRIVGGVPAVLIGQAGSSVTYTGNAQEAEALADAGGAAGIRVTQPAPRPGRTRVAVEVVKPDPNGVGPGTVVGRSETVVEWAAPQLTLDLKLPGAAALNRELPVTVAVANGGKVDSEPVTVRAAVPEGAEFVRAEPEPTRCGGRDLAWTLGGLAAGEARDVTLVLRPTRRGPLAVAAGAETADGLRADRKAAVEVGTAGLRVSLDAPPAASVGGAATVRVGVTNTGAVPLENVLVWVTAGDGLRHESGANPVEVTVGPVAPGKTRTVEVPFSAEKAGKAAVRVNVAADGGLADRADAAVAITRSEITAAVTGPDVVAVGQDALFEIRVTNAGDAAVTNAAVRVVLPPGLRRREDDRGPTVREGGGSDGASEWPLGPLNPSETKVVRLTATGDRPAADGTLTVAASADVPGGGPGLTAKASAPVAVVGQPVLVMELADPAGPVVVGGRAVYRVTVRNRGTGPAHRVEVAADLTGGLTPVRGAGPGRTTATVEDGKLTFPAVEELPAGAAAAFTIEADAGAAGDARVSARVGAKGLAAALREEQATRVRRR